MDVHDRQHQCNKGRYLNSCSDLITAVLSTPPATRVRKSYSEAILSARSGEILMTGFSACWPTTFRNAVLMADTKYELEGYAEASPDRSPTLERRVSIETGNTGRPSCFTSTFREVLFVLTTTMGVAMASLLAGSVTVTSSFIGRDLDMTTAEITWISSAASLSAGSFLLFFGKIADLFGRRLMLISSVLLFSIFSLAAGFAQQPLTLDFLNGVLGLFSASSVPPALGLLGVVYKTPCKRRNYAFACFSAGNPLGFAMGALFGGVAATIFDWRASFWLIAIIFSLLAVLAFWAVPQDPTVKEKLSLDTLKRFDLLGVSLVILGNGMFAAALSLGDNAPDGWKTNYVLALLILSVVCMIAFVLWDLYYEYALVPMQIFKNRNFSLAMAILALGFLAFTPGIFFNALFFQDVWRTSPIMTAVYLLPMFIVGLGVNIVAGLVLHRVSNKLLMWIATISYTIAFCLLALNRADYSYWALCFPAQILIVTAVDLQINVCTVLTMTSLPQSHQSIAGGILHTIVRLTATVGFGIATAIFNAVQQEPSLSAHWDEDTQPFAAVFWFCAACSALSIVMVPFLTIRTQGGANDNHACKG